MSLCVATAQALFLALARFDIEDAVVGTRKRKIVSLSNRACAAARVALAGVAIV